MNCIKCGNKMAREWSYCPYCGEEIIKNGLFDGINKMINGLLGSFFEGKPIKSDKFTIRIKAGDNEQVITSHEKPVMIQPKIIKMPEELIEPKSNIKSLGNEIELTIELPGIKSLNEVSITHLSESLEIRAVRGDKGYFKLISVPINYRILNKSIDNNILSVRMGAK